MDSELLSILVVFGAVAIVVIVFVRVSMRLRRGGGSLTTTILGATDGFLEREKSKAAETIVDENAGKTKNPMKVPSSLPESTSREE